MYYVPYNYTRLDQDTVFWFFDVGENRLSCLVHLHLACLAPQSVNGGAPDGPIRNLQHVLLEEIPLPPLFAPFIAQRNRYVHQLAMFQLLHDRVLKHLLYPSSKA